MHASNEGRCTKSSGKRRLRVALTERRRRGWQARRLRRQKSLSKLRRREPQTSTHRKAVQQRENGLALLGELAPPELEWQYPLKDEQWRCYAGYLPGALSKDHTLAFFKVVREGTEWLQPSGRWGPLPLRTAWMTQLPCSCKYRYGGAEVLPAPFPNWMHDVMAVCMPLCGLRDAKEWPNSCNLNLYMDGQHSVGWHADNESLFQGKVQDCRIISLSLGQTRKFELRYNDAILHSLDLTDGDLLTMEGMTQRFFQHRVPKEQQDAGPRINLTWRWVVQHTDDCSLNQRMKM